MSKWSVFLLPQFRSIIPSVAPTFTCNLFTYRGMSFQEKRISVSCAWMGSGFSIDEVLLWIGSDLYRYLFNKWFQNCVLNRYFPLKQERTSFLLCPFSQLNIQVKYLMTQRSMKVVLRYIFQSIFLKRLIFQCKWWC